MLTMKKILILICLLLVLFFSSGQSYDQQSLIPTLQKWLPEKPFESALSVLQIPYWGIIVSVDERGYYYFVEFLVRKAAHFFMFGFLSIVVYVLLPKHSTRYFTAVIITALFAIADEFHQSMTIGRTATIQDVYLDTAGAIIVLMLFKVIIALKKPTKKRRF